MEEILKNKVFTVKIHINNLIKNFKEIKIEEIIEVEEIKIIHTNISKDNINKDKYIIILECQIIKNYQIKIFNHQMKVLKKIQIVKKVKIQLILKQMIHKNSHNNFNQ